MRKDDGRKVGKRQQPRVATDPSNACLLFRHFSRCPHKEIHPSVLFSFFLFAGL
jgi:hypothetical protein